MPTQSANYGLWIGMVTDDFIQPQHVDTVARVVDRVLGGVVGGLLAPGVYAGWEVGSDGQVTAGWGVLGAALGATGAEQAITGLVNGTLNYVFAVPGSDIAPNGTVIFAAQTAAGGPAGAVGPAGALYLGTVTLDAGGNVTAEDNAAAGVSRGVFPLTATTLSGSGTVAAVPAGQPVTVTVTHAALAVPGAISFTVSSGFTYVLSQTWQGTGFTAVVTNGGTAAADLTYGWVRQGIG